jgi:hypothetical protein
MILREIIGHPLETAPSFVYIDFKLGEGETNSVVVYDHRATLLACRVHQQKEKGTEMSNGKKMHMTILREILMANPSLSNGEIVDRAIAQGVTLQRRVLMKRLSTLRTRMTKSAVNKKLQSSTVPKKQQDTAMKEPAMKDATLESAVAAKAPTTVAEFFPQHDLNPVFATLAQVYRVSELCGGTANLHQVVNAIHACGGIKPFQTHLDMIDEIRKSLATN